MSKAKDLSQNRYPTLAEKYAFIDGYHQAEKDNELTWEDMMVIHRCVKDAMNYHLYKMLEGTEGQKTVYQDVLKRFKNMKDGSKR